MQIKLFTIPNLITLSNLLCGAAATVAALAYDDLYAAFWFVVAAAVCDFLDGFTARLLQCFSPLGVQLDSLADMVSFGVAPSAVLYALVLDGGVTGAGAFSVFVLAAFSALRLAKFNIDETQSVEFCGLPTPAAALFCAGLGLLSFRGDVSLAAWMPIAAAVVLALLLISPIRMFSLKFHGFGWRGNGLRYGFILFALAAVAALRWFAVPAIILTYVVVSTVRWVTIRRRSARANG